MADHDASRPPAAPTRPLDVAAARLGDLASGGVPVGPLTTYRVGGAAALLVRAETLDDLGVVASAVGETGIEVLTIGKGSNLLVADGGFPGLVVVLGESFASIEIDGTRVRAGAAATLPVVARRSAAAGLTGFEWAVGVPGTVGGAVRMNAGGHGSDMAATLERVRVFDLQQGDHRDVQSADLDLRYRCSTIAPHELVLWADLRLRPGDRTTSEAELGEIVRWRRAHQPGGPNAGSVFTNPPGESAGRLIDAAGLKGLRVGTAEVSSKHANFIQADDGGRADDVYALMSKIRTRVFAATGVVLHAETRLVGFAPMSDPRLEVEGR